MCRLTILIHSTGTVCCFLSDGPQSFQNPNPNLLQLWFHVCMFCICNMCFGASESFYSTCQGRRFTSVIQTANLSKCVSPSVPTRADWFVSTNSRACFTAILVCICVSAISVALFLHAAAYFYTGYVIIHASDVEFEGSSRCLHFL